MNNSKTVTFSATAQEKHPSGKAILLLDCKQGSETLFSRVYMPISQMQIKLINSKTKRVSVTIPEWLFDSKMEDEVAFQSSTAVLDQLGFLTADNANHQIPEKADNSFRDKESA